MRTSWIVVADSACATLYEAAAPNAPLNEIHTYLHAEARMHEQKLTSDLPGRTFDSMGSNRHAMSSPTDPKREEAIRFAKELVQALERGRNEHRFERLYVAAPPAFLGLLRSHYSAPLAAMVAQELDKNLTGESMPALRRQLPEFL